MEHDRKLIRLACSTSSMIKLVNYNTSFDVLFPDDEMAGCHTSGTKGFQQLDSRKLGFLVSVLQRKFDSPCFSEQWNQIAARINTKCRGKRRTLIHRLKKTSLF